MRPEFTVLYKKGQEKKITQEALFVEGTKNLTQKTFSKQQQAGGLQENQWGWEISRAQTHTHFWTKSHCKL